MKSANFQRRRNLRTAASAEEVPSPVPAAAPVDEPVVSSNPFAKWPKSALEDVLADLSKYADEKGVLDSIQQIAEEIRKRPEEVVEQPKAASFAVTDEETSDVIEGYLKEIAEAKAKTVKPPVDGLPAVTSPSKFAGEMTAAKAAKLAESVAEKLKALFIEAKVITGANETRPVREAVDTIFVAYQKMGTAQELLEKQTKQEEAEEAAQEAAMKGKKSASAKRADNAADAFTTDRNDKDDEAATKKEAAMDPERRTKLQEGDDSYDPETSAYDRYGDHARCQGCRNEFLPNDAELDADFCGKCGHGPFCENCRPHPSHAKGGRTIRPYHTAKSASTKKTMSSLLGNLVVAGAEKSASRSTRKDRAEFVRLIAEHAPKAQSKQINEQVVASIAEELLRLGSTHARIQEFHTNGINWKATDPKDLPRWNEEQAAAEDKYGKREKEVEAKITGLCAQLGCSPVFDSEPRGCTVKISCPDGFTNDWKHEGIVVPTAA